MAASSGSKGCLDCVQGKARLGDFGVLTENLKMQEGEILRVNEVGWSAMLCLMAAK